MIEWGVRLDQNDLARLRGKLKAAPGKFLAAAAAALPKAAEVYYLILMEHIGEYRGGEFVFPDTYWPELSKSWLQEKRSHGWVEEIWQATGGVKGAIAIHAVNIQQSEAAVFVGLKNVAPDILQRAMENEFGAMGFAARGLGITMFPVPARPLFEPAKRLLVSNSYYWNLVLDQLKIAFHKACIRV